MNFLKKILELLIKKGDSITRGELRIALREEGIIVGKNKLPGYLDILYGMGLIEIIEERPFLRLKISDLGKKYYECLSKYDPEQIIRKGMEKTEV